MKVFNTSMLLLSTLAVSTLAAPAPEIHSLAKRNIPYDIVRIIIAVVEYVKGKQDPDEVDPYSTYPSDFCKVTAGSYTTHDKMYVRQSGRDNQCFVAVQCDGYFMNYTTEHFGNMCCYNCEVPSFLDQEIGGFSVKYTASGLADSPYIGAGDTSHDTVNTMLWAPVFDVFGVGRNLTNEGGATVDPYRMNLPKPTDHSIAGCTDVDCFITVPRKGKGIATPGMPYGEGIWNNGAHIPVTHSGAMQVTWENCKPKDPHTPVNYWDTTGNCDHP